MKTLAELEAALEERGVSMVVHQGASPGPVWIVWIYAPDDPAIFFIGDGKSLVDAVEDAIEEWDLNGEDEGESESPKKKPEPS